MEANWGLIGNERAVRALQAIISAGGRVHSYLFHGPEGTGRFTAARRLAMALNCLESGAPCGLCSSCRRIEAEIHPDVQTITIDTQAEGAARKSISVEQLREVEASVALSPYEGRARVVIIDPADLMSDAAQNSFLKTLEEPPAHAIFVLITTSEERLLETIRSRCTRVEFRLVPTADIEAALITRGLEADRAGLLARLSAGRPGWAISAANNPRLLEQRAETLQKARSLPRLSLAERFDVAEKLSESFKRERAPALHMLDEWAGWWRDVLLAQSGAGDSIANVDRADDVAIDARQYSRWQVSRFVQSIVETRGYLADNVQSRVALDALMLDVPE